MRMTKWLLVLVVAACLLNILAAVLLAPYAWSGTFDGISQTNRVIGIVAALASFILGGVYYVWHFANWRKKQGYSQKSN